MHNPGVNLNDQVPGALARAITFLVSRDFDEAAFCFAFEYATTKHGVIAYGRVNNPDRAPAAEVKIDASGNECDFTETHKYTPTVLLPMVLIGLLSELYPQRTLVLSRVKPGGRRVTYFFNNGAITSE